MLCTRYFFVEADPIMIVESWTLPLWIIRSGNQVLNYTDNLANPHDEQHKHLVTAFEKGVGESYASTPLRNGFVVAEVNDISRPSDFIKVVLNFQRK
ncbi:unnamed protein product [Gongylonema pulchrum]|uniref:SEA domain-containing protein n=1 Tax=Gongylonema pulchrum TaxID=637853 RepID=A0A183D7D0_9BILA|nr:unnamed protein product [Gongylonema pulchrum]